MSWTRGELDIWAEFKEWDEHGGLGGLDMGRKLYYRVNGVLGVLVHGLVGLYYGVKRDWRRSIGSEGLAFGWRSYTVYKKP